MLLPALRAAPLRRPRAPRLLRPGPRARRDVVAVVSHGVTPAAAVQLRAARERIATPERWVQGVFAAVDGKRYGAPSINDPRACLCVDGAVLSVRNNQPANGAGLCLSLAARARGFETASKLNDAPETTHADVLALLDEAIALAESLAGAES